MAVTDERGFWLNREEEYIHPDLVKPNEELKDEMVEKLLHEARQKSEMLAQFKQKATDEIQDYFDLLLQNYGLDEKRRTRKGNISLENFSSTMKVQVAMGETLDFDEKLQIAKEKIDEYLEDITKDADPAIRTLVTRAFDVDKKGKIDSKKIFALKSYEITDSRWKEAMDIIDESKRVSHVKPYVRFYKRKSIRDSWKIVPLDISKVGGDE